MPAIHGVEREQTVRHDGARARERARHPEPDSGGAGAHGRHPSIASLTSADA
jgi:hypothetical protein